MIVGVAAVAIAGGGAYGVNRLAQGGKVTEVGVERAVEVFRSQVPTTIATSSTASPSTPAFTTVAVATTIATIADGGPVTATATTTPAPTAPAPALPGLGVYVYATSGYDEVDVLTGARHQYPQTTTITVTPHGCGVRLRWDVAEERWDSWDWCLEGDGIQVTGLTSFHQFFGVAGQNDYVCTGDPRPLDAEPGTVWETLCRSGDSDTSAYRGMVVGTESLVVGGTPVDALHVRVEVTVSGVSTGAHTVEGWYRTTDGLPLRETVAIDTEQSTAIGATSFVERSLIELTSLTPES